ncbi:MAG: hypothetical protein ACKE51_02250 [Methylococcaceae bacterium]
MYKYQYPSDKIFLKATHNLNNALQWVNTGDYWHQLSHLKSTFFLAQDSDEHNENDIISDIKTTNKTALTMMPMNPYAWYDKAFIDSLYQEVPNSSLIAIKMSAYAERVNHKLLKPRVMFLWENHHKLDNELRASFKSQLLLLWQLRRNDLVEVINKHPDIQYSIFDLLSNSPDDLTTFSDILIKQGL